MSETLREIVNKCSDIYTFSINKHDDFDRYMWEFKVTDKDSSMYGVTDKLVNYDYKIVTLRRGNHFFLAYKFTLPNNKKVYFVDIRKANHKTSVEKFVDGLVFYYMKSNDISYKKDDNSFKVSEMKMKTLGINNFLDLCYYFREYSAIGIGYTRDVRNLIVLDIDVDCRKKENKDELDRILELFALNNILPDFEIHNNGNGHIQLQWLIQSYQYKKRCEEQLSELISRLNSERNKNKEVGGVSMNSNYVMDTEKSVGYRIITKSLTDISDKPKFGDKNFTFWKAKNFCTALFRMQNLELKMPQYRDGKVIYLSQEEMVDLFSTKERRKLYYDEAPTFDDFVSFSEPILSEYINNEKNVKENFEDDEYEDLEPNYDRKREIYEDSRNNYVFKHTKEITWGICRDWGLKSSEDIAKLPKEKYIAFENEIYGKVRKDYLSKNKKYHGSWPGTSNLSPFSKKEFESAFKIAFNFAKCKFNNLSKYSDEQRDNSKKERGLKKDMRLILVDYLRNKNQKIKRDDLLKLVNDTLEKSNQKKISLSSLKRYIEMSKSMSIGDREKLYSYYYENFKERKNSLSDTEKDSDGVKRMKKKKLDYISINIIDDIMKK